MTINRAKATGETSKMATGTKARATRRLWAYAAMVVVSVASGAMFVACSDDKQSDGPTTGAVCPTTSTLTYANFGQVFMQSYCLRCHSSTLPKGSRGEAPEDHNFDMLVDIRVFKNHIDQYAGSGPAATNDIMPPDMPRPTTEERAKLSEWLACNAPM